MSTGKTPSFWEKLTISCSATECGGWITLDSRGEVLAIEGYIGRYVAANLNRHSPEEVTEELRWVLKQFHVPPERLSTTNVLYPANIASTLLNPDIPFRFDLLLENCQRPLFT